MKKRKKFQTEGVCIPSLHYMADTSAAIGRIIDGYIEQGAYFTINRARQYGKTTTLELLYQRLRGTYIVLDISFEAADDCFVSVYTMAQGLIQKVTEALLENEVSDELLQFWKEPVSRELPLADLSAKITGFCRQCKKGVILMVDEVDKSAGHQLFLSFLGLLREKYLKQLAGRDHTFLSVILAGVYDIKNLKLKLHPQEEPKYNSPWSNAAHFTGDLSLSRESIQGMLEEYEQDCHTGMDCKKIAGMIYDYTNGYPFLVSYICKKIDEEISGSSQFPQLSDAWTREGVLAAIKLLVTGPNTLYDDMIKHVSEYHGLYDMLHDILFSGQEYAYHEYEPSMEIGRMFGFLVNRSGVATVANRIFETQLYTWFLANAGRKERIASQQLPDKHQFQHDGELDMDHVMRCFYEYYTALYSREDDSFLEKYGRKIFLMYLSPILNGSGNFYVEDQSRSKRRSDIVIDFHGKQYIVECKIWDGEEYNRRGRKQLREYMDAYQTEKGYLLSFNFNKKKSTGIQTIWCDGKPILEVVV